MAAFIIALVCTPCAQRNRTACTSRARTTRARIAALDSPGAAAESSAAQTGVTSTCMSILSISGPEIRLM